MPMQAPPPAGRAPHHGAASAWVRRKGGDAVNPMAPEVRAVPVDPAEARGTVRGLTIDGFTIDSSAGYGIRPGNRGNNHRQQYHHRQRHCNMASGPKTPEAHLIICNNTIGEKSDTVPGAS